MEIEISPDDPHWKNARMSPTLRESSWGSALFRFDADGKLAHIEIYGD